MASVFPFEKNRYFPNKRMLAADFTRELAYMDRKFQLLQHWTLGMGMLFGLQVQRLDGENLLVSPGVAVDGQGRYLAVDEPAVCRLAALPGFETLTGERALLMLSYREENKEPVYVAAEQGTQKQEYAVCTERYAFSLRADDAETDAVQTRLFVEDILYEDATLCIRQMMPQVVSAQRPVMLRLLVDNLNPEPQQLRLHYTPRMVGFTPEPDCLDKRLTLPTGRTTLELRMTPDTPADTTVLEVPADGFSLEFRDKTWQLEKPCRQEVTVTPGDVLAVLAGRCRDLSMQDTWQEDPDGVPIALVRFFRYQDSVLLDDVVPLPGAPQAGTPVMDRRLDSCRAFFPSESPAAAHPSVAAPQEPAPAPRQMTTGVVTLPVGLHLDEEQVLHSGEIVHNLGLGTVYVEFGVESVYPTADLAHNCTDLLLGDASLFALPGGSYSAGIRRGVLVHPERGTFEMALRVPGELPQAALQLRWFAWRPQERIVSTAQASHLIGLEPNVLYAEPGTVIHFTPVFAGEPLACEFFVPGRQAGLVTRDGLYTAPQKEGLYQVCARLREDPQSKVSAFVIVRAQAEGGSDDKNAL